MTSRSPGAALDMDDPAMMNAAEPSIEGAEPHDAFSLLYHYSAPLPTREDVTGTSGDPSY
ncbi:uncharacterized protein LDX57_001088 [Aspergillus melleus]|uniref:uncharacterized protein n=1 Tax=Aspergillus melleus TaxID=138277 RepID=UPI001E8E4738|nr:uncharacterized protein LDX57_001088 [Aspergillus melleus]KAH8423330.1 hypothetical protein LDX57_001088 [Aspergillus melleus]